jgi:hypothetical protein
MRMMKRFSGFVRLVVSIPAVMYRSDEEKKKKPLGGEVYDFSRIILSRNCPNVHACNIEY